MLLACLSSSAFAAERNNPIDPWTYQSLLGRGMDVDWCKTRQGMETYDRQIVENFRDMGLSHVRIRVKDDADEQLFSVLDRVIDDCLDCGVIPGRDMTTEAIVTKMMWALGQTEDPAEVKEIFARNYCGEVSE